MGVVSGLCSQLIGFQPWFISTMALYFYPKVPGAKLVNSVSERAQRTRGDSGFHDRPGPLWSFRLVAVLKRKLVWALECILYKARGHRAVYKLIL